MPENEVKENVNQSIIEIRYKPNSKILDYRGSYAEMISKLMGLEHWKITENRIDVYDNEDNKRVFVSFRNSGISINNLTNNQLFLDQALKYFGFLFNDKPFGEKININRIGLRYRNLNKYEGPYEELVIKYHSSMFIIPEETKQAFGYQITDVGFPLDFRDNQARIHTLSGPMSKEQALDFFKFESNDTLPNCGFYIDIDYWEILDEEMNFDQLSKKLSIFHSKVINMNKGVNKLIFDGGD